VKPIYFPFTYLCAPGEAALRCCFPAVVVYQPMAGSLPPEMQDAAGTGFLDIRTPFGGDDSKIKDLIAQYQHWVALHGKSRVPFFKARGDAIPFFDESHTTQIRSHIKNYNSDESPTPAIDRVLEARVFLQMAQEYDRQEAMLRREINAYRDLEAALLDTLHGATGRREQRLSLPGALPGDSRMPYMLAERLGAWTHLLAREGGGSGLFVTTSAELGKILREAGISLEPLCRVEGLSTVAANTDEGSRWRKDLVDVLQRLMVRPWDAEAPDPIVPPSFQGSGPTAALEMHIAPELPPTELFQRFGGDWPKLAPSHPKGQSRHTIIAVVQTPSAGPSFAPGQTAFDIN
jgi:hypothetical protein